LTSVQKVLLNGAKERNWTSQVKVTEVFWIFDKILGDVLKIKSEEASDDDFTQVAQ